MTISTIGVAHPSTDRLIAGMLILIMPQLLNAIPEPGELEIEPPNLQPTPPIELPPDSPASPEVPPQQPPAQPQRPPQMKPELGNIAGVVPDSKRLAYEIASRLRAPFQLLHSSMPSRRDLPAVRRFRSMTAFGILIRCSGTVQAYPRLLLVKNSEELIMRRFLIILEGATIGIVVAYGVLGLWRDWKMSQWPEAVVEQFEIHPVSPPEGLGI